MEAALAAAVLVTAAAAAAWLGSARTVDLGSALACVAAYAAAARVTLFVGGGCAMPTQLVLVPMLFLLPLPAVPAAVVCGTALAAAWDVAFARAHWERLVTAVGDAGYALAPVAVLAVAGEPGPTAVVAVLAACVAQFGFDALLSVGREWAGRRIRPGVQLRVMATVYGVDALLVPVGLLVADRAASTPAALVAVVALAALLAAITRDRNRRLDEALDRLDVITRERARVRAAVDRLGRSFGSPLDRRATLELILDAAVDGVEAQAGRATLVAGALSVATGNEAAMELLVRAEAAALASGDPVCATQDGWTVVAQPMPAPPGTDGGAIGVVAVAAAAGFSEDDERLLAFLAGKATRSVESIELHERLRDQATVDELTGLANHRRFHEVLAGEIERTRRTGEGLALVLVDVDDFKRVNDTYGHQAGDEVLRAVGGALRDRCRRTDTPARYGGEELAVVVVGTDLEGAYATAEDLRTAIAALRVATVAGQLRVTASLGVAELGAGIEDATALVAAADEALYAAKRAGKNRTVAAVSATA